MFVAEEGEGVVYLTGVFSGEVVLETCGHREDDFWVNQICVLGICVLRIFAEVE